MHQMFDVFFTMDRIQMNQLGQQFKNLEQSTLNYLGISHIMK